MKVDLNVVLQPNIKVKGEAKIPYRMVKLDKSWEQVVNECAEIPIMADYSYLASNGKDLYTSRTSVDGIWYTDLETGISTQIYTSGKRYQRYFEDSKGNIYAISVTNGYIIHLKGNIATFLISDSKSKDCSYFFEDSKGNCYISSDISSSGGIFYIKDTTATLIQTLRGAKTYFEDSKGNVYCGANYNSYSPGILHLDGDTSTVITGSYSKYPNFFEDSKGNVYAFGAYSLMYLSGTTGTEITSAKGYNMFEDSKGRLFLTSSSGIYSIVNSTVTQISTEKMGETSYFFEDGENIYISGAQNTTGIVHINSNDLVATKITGVSGYEFNIFFKDLDGNVYCYNSITSSNYPVIHLDGATGTAINVDNYPYHFMDTKGNVYIVATAKIYIVQDNTITQIFGSSTTCPFKFDSRTANFFEKNGKTYVSNGEVKEGWNIAELDGQTVKLLYYKGDEE